MFAPASSMTEQQRLQPQLQQQHAPAGTLNGFAEGGGPSGLSFDEQLYYMRLRQLLQQQLELSELQIQDQTFEENDQLGSIISFENFQQPRGSSTVENYSYAKDSDVIGNTGTSTDADLKWLASDQGFGGGENTVSIAESSSITNSSETPSVTTADSNDIVSAVVAMGIEGSAGDSIKGLTGRLPIQLYLTCNDDYMSQYQCIVRKQIEFFEATSVDIESVIQGRNKPIVLGQVGIRCRHCSLFIIQPNRRPNGSTYYPSKLQSIYQACQNMAQVHLLETCTYMPQSVRDELVRLREESLSNKRRLTRVSEKSAPGGGKQFWASTAASLGVIEDQDSEILRFDPCWSMKILHHHATEERKAKELARLRAQQDEKLAKDDDDDDAGVYNISTNEEDNQFFNDDDAIETGSLQSF